MESNITMDEKLIYEFVGKKIRQIRERADITQEKLAPVLGASRASIANYEGGRQAISISDLYKLADYLKVQITDFLPSVEEMKEKSAPEQVLEKAQDLKEIEKEEIKTFIEKIS
jgi:transcriptional regulator with XRE-family HTH domain